jgi:hypothetical protein
MADQAVFFEILDLVTGNTVAGFDDFHEAHEELARLADERPRDRDRLALVLFDAEGDALEVRLAGERIPA